MPETPQEEARAALSAAGQLPDAEIDLAAVALQFARIDAPDADWRAATAQLTAMAQAAVAAAAGRPRRGRCRRCRPAPRRRWPPCCMARFGFSRRCARPMTTWPTPT